MPMPVRLLAAGCLVALALPAPAAKPRYGEWGVDLSAMKPSVRPGDDFNAWVNGAWLDRTAIAPDRTSAGVDVTLTDEAERNVRAIVEDMAHGGPAAGATERQVGDFYASFMDEAGIEARGTAPLRPWLARIDAVKTRADLVRLFMTPGYVSPVGVGLTVDPDAPTRYTAEADQSGLGLPNRDYYLLTGAKYDQIRAGYRAYLVKLQQLAGMTGAEARADRVVALETALAKDQWAPERTRDIKQVYNPMTRAQLAALAPQFGWTPMLADMGLGAAPIVIVSEPSTIAAVGRMLDAVPLATWRDYLALQFISSSAPYLPKAFDDARFAFYGKTLRDQPEQRARWKRGVALVDDSLGEAVGRIYVQRHYPPESERQMSELIANLRAAYAERFRAAGWMDPATLAQANAKLAAFDPRIGHPVRYIDYAPLHVDRDDVLGNVMRSEDFEWRLQLSRLPKPVDRTLWYMTPQEVNAYYDPSQNQITFPAAILQPPYFDPAADPAINYGGIGATIGHEMGHGFDDQGRQFDATGKLRDWWTPVSAARFTQRSGALAKQYDGYEPIPGVHINGRLTLGENIGDLGGLEVAYAAYRKYVAQNGEPPVLNGFTGDQRFFIAYAQSWQSKRREGATRAQLLSNPHSPDAFRVNGIVRNIDAWYKAFGIKPGDKLYLPPDQRVHIW